MTRRVLALVFASLVLMGGCSGGCRRVLWRGPAKVLEKAGFSSDEAHASAVPEVPIVDPKTPLPAPGVTGHPRLWMRAGDVAKLQGFAKAPDGVYAKTFRPLLERTKQTMDKNEEVFKNATCADGSASDTCESYALLFAFASVVDPSDTDRRAYAARARTILMRLLDEAGKGVDPKAESWRYPRSRKFSTDDRSRWHGEAFPLTVDWIYSSLTAADKATIRKVFLRWCDENVHADITTMNRPEPIGVVNDPVLVKDRAAVRFAGNNYYAAHMRNLGLMAMSMDPADDDGGKLRGYLRNATGAWLYVVNHLLETDAKGGIGPEGFEYAPQTLSYVFEFLLGLETAGEAVPQRWGKQAALADGPFWDDAITAFFHMQSPGTATHPWMGPIYQPVWFGDGQAYYTSDFIDLFGSIGAHAALTGKTKRLEATRFLQREFPPGGSKGFDERLQKLNRPRNAILYFLLFDPAAPVPRDPRPGTPLSFFAPGMGHEFARTSWGPEATLFHTNLSWIGIDHQGADGGNFSFYRQGEWLTKHRAGYGNAILATEWHNAIAIENSRPSHSDDSDWRSILWKRGSQWFNGIAEGDPIIANRSEGPTYLYFHGDSTHLFNSTYEGSTDVAHASRATVWLKPDFIVVYDRVTSKTERRFKRFWVQLAEPASVQGNVATMTSKKGQKLYVTKLLPQNGTMTAFPEDLFKQETADYEPMKARLKTEAALADKDVRFLHVLQGALGAAEGATLITSRSSANYDGVVVAQTAVLFPRSYGAKVSDVSYVVPAATRSHLVTGLEPMGGYDVEVKTSGSETTVNVRRGRGKVADEGGVLAF